jgi:hypothetical protein
MVQNEFRMHMVTEAISVIATSDSTFTHVYIGQYYLHSHRTAARIWSWKCLHFRSHLHPTEQKFQRSDLELGSVMLKSHFLFRFLWSQFLSGIIHTSIGIQVPLEVLYLMDVSQTSCYSLNMIHCCSVLLTCCITKQSSVCIDEFQVPSFGLLTWKSCIVLH